jgi:hypothetical protein
VGFLGWSFNFRLHPKIGRHLRGNITRKGWRSTSAVWGWLSLNFTRRGLRRITIDTPGPGSFSHTFGKKPRRARRRS